MHIITYPMSQGEIPQLEPIIEYHIVTPRGTLSATYEDKALAIQRWRECSPGFKLMEVTRRFREITPEAKQSKQSLELVA